MKVYKWGFNPKARKLNKELKKMDIEEFTDRELIEQTEICIREMQNRELEIPQIDKYWNF